MPKALCSLPPFALRHAKRPPFFSKDGLLRKVIGLFYFCRLEKPCICSFPIKSHSYADAMGIAPLQMELVYKENFLNHLENGTLEQLCRKHFAKDYRRSLSMAALQGDSNWTYFFGICLAVKKAAYIAAGRFDESLSGWGIEDLDFTFRLKNHGKLLFIPQSQLFHIPHTRDRYKNYEQNAYNNIECLKKYEGKIEWELSYKSEKLYEVLAVIEQIKYHHRALNYQMPMDEQFNTIYINALSEKFPNGSIIVFNEHEKKFNLRYIGISLPIKNKQFEKCYLSFYILNYPAPILAQVLQEACRVAFRVQIPKTSAGPRIRWGKDIETKCKAHSQRFEIFPVKLSDFTFQDKGSYYEIITSLPDSPFQDNKEVYYEFI